MIRLTLKTFAALVSGCLIASAKNTPAVEIFTGIWGLLVLWAVACSREILEAFGGEDG